MYKYAIIVAGGSGVRMGNVVPKQFLLLNDKPILYYTIKSFLDAYADMQVVLVLPEEYMKVGKELVEKKFNQSSIQYATGGETRFHSVKNGLQLIKEESIIFVHDAVRCMVTVGLIQRCYEQCLQTGTAIPVIAAKDSLRLITTGGTTSEPIDRNNVVMVQTPQCFHSQIILPAFNIDYKEHFTDEATVVESFGIKVSLVAGEESNIKITHPVDLLIAESILNKSFFGC
jgi:2-C-methyl-D-erythritol 4-phosphate cytidylyltransferase